MDNILVIAAHPDDELLGIGGTVRRLANDGKNVRALILAEGITSRADSRESADFSNVEELRRDAEAAARIVGYNSIDFCDYPDNRMDSVDLLDVIKTVSKHINQYNPDTIFTHHHGDLNVDHRITCEAVLTSCRPVGNYNVKRIFAFETPSSTEWNYNYNQCFKPNVFFNITDTIESKIEGLNCYQSESASFPHPRSPEALRSLGRYRGSNSGYEYAEAFMLLRACVE